MSRLYRKLTGRLPNDSGQTMVIVVLALGLFLLGAVAFGTDIANLWFHRQAAQTAADAACTAGIMDMLYQAEGAASYTWVTNKTTDCNGLSGPLPTGIAPCWYAAKNGYGGADYAGGIASVALSYPTSNSNVTTSTGGTIYLPPSSVVANPFLQVNVRDRVRVFFAPLLNGGNTTMDVGAKAVCVILEAQSPIPLLVLDPKYPSWLSGNNQYAFTVQGSPTVAIWGGPPQSIQVDSQNPTYAVNTGGSGSVNLTLGGPPGPGTGSNFGMAGGGTTTGVQCGTGDPNCVIPHGPISDPFEQLATPPPQAAPANFSETVNGTTYSCTATQVVNGNCQVPFGIDGCQNASGCTEYTPGYYASGIQVKGSQGSAAANAIFDPGIYQLAGGKTGGFIADSNSCLRPSTYDSASTGIGGTMFYLSGADTTVNVDNNSGAHCPAAWQSNLGSVDPALPQAALQCTAGSSYPSNTPTSLTGNVLLAPCTGTYGDQYLANFGTVDPNLGEQRGILLFQDRSDTTLDAKGSDQNPSWGGGGSFLLDGTIYIHSCNASGTGAPCGGTPPYFTDVFTLQGNSGSATWVLGDIVVDNLQLGGSSSITMDLNPTPAFYTLKASLIQ